MKVHGDYAASGYAHVEGLISPDVATAFLRQIRADLPDLSVRFLSHAPIIKKTSVDVYAHEYRPMLQFLWGLTPTLSTLTGRDLLPTYNYFRLYRQGDICRVHSDRPACEHSVSLTLGYSDDATWPFEVGATAISEPEPIADLLGKRAQWNELAARRRLLGAAEAQRVIAEGDRAVERGDELRREALHGRIRARHEAVGQELRVGEQVSQIVIDLAHGEAEGGEAAPLIEQMVQLGLHVRQLALCRADLVLALGRRDDAARVLGALAETLHVRS